MGYHGMRSVLVLEFDVQLNEDKGDPSGNHVSWHGLGAGQPVSAAHVGSLSHTSNIPVLSDGLPHRVRVRYDPLLEAHHFSDPTFDFSSFADAHQFLFSREGVEGVGAGRVQVGALSIWIDDLWRPVLTTPINLERMLGLSPGERVFVGVTSASGEEYAEVVIDSFSLSDRTCPSDCNDRGECAAGQCFCEEGFQGHDCSQIDNASALGL
jgi:hypothetical protein